MIVKTSPGALREARVQLHHAAQIAAAAGNTLLPHLDDHSHRNLRWMRRVGCFVGPEIEGLRAGIRVGDLAWVVVKEDSVFDSRIARGYTRDQGLSWLSHTWEQAGGAQVDFQVPGYDIPDHEIGLEGSFGGAKLVDADLYALSAWYVEALSQLGAIAERYRGSEVRLWPHHLDVATLIPVAGAGEDARSVGISFTPGDTAISQPYFSVSPWPYPDPVDLPEIPDGYWHTDGFTAAVLRGDQGADDPERVRAFLAVAVDASVAVVQG
ncbi:MAG: hypothetical protein AB8H79_04515 [Myxococcota bacterium]